MARKSRKEAIRAANGGYTAAVQPSGVCESETAYNAWGYVRLSILDTRYRNGSESLQNQKALLREYAERHSELHLIEICEDNGETGTNFNRAGFEKLMEAVYTGRANCVIVKDLSRFGRDYLETGNYLEHVFPSLGVRFISVADGYDSADATTSECLTVALKNLLNQIYSADISRKSGSVLREKIKRGEFIGGYAAYGYLKDPADRHHLVIDPEAAAVVRKIYEKRLGGMGNTAITRWLNESGILSPCCYRYQKGILLDERFAQPRTWKVQTVKSILENQVYLGHTVQGRRRSEFYSGKPDRLLPPEEWTIVENTHEPIINQVDFDNVQAMCAEKKSQYHTRLGRYDHLGKSENILKGLIFCGDCGRPMVRYKQVSHGQNVFYRYLCPNYADMLERSGCSYKYLPEEVLLETLRQVIAKEVEQAVDAAALAKKLSQGKENQIASRAAEIKRLNTRLFQVESRKKASMQDYLSGELSCSEYERLRECCDAEAEELKDKILVLRAGQRKDTEILTEENPWLRAFGSVSLADQQLTSELAHALIERITIFAENRIEVIFRFQNEREQLLSAAEGGVA